MKRKKISPERRKEIDRILAEAAEKAMARQPEPPVNYREKAARELRQFSAKVVGDLADRQLGVVKTPKQTRWNQLPHNAKKASRRPITPVDAVVTKSTCDHCRMPMWTADKRLETTCEDCEFRLITEKHELRQKMERTAGGRLVNAFADNPQPVINTFGSKSDNLI